VEASISNSRARAHTRALKLFINMTSRLFFIPNLNDWERKCASRGREDPVIFAPQICKIHYAEAPEAQLGTSEAEVSLSPSPSSFPHRLAVSLRPAVPAPRGSPRGMLCCADAPERGTSEASISAYAPFRLSSTLPSAKRSSESRRALRRS
jgi:hypothetical protein